MQKIYFEKWVDLNHQLKENIEMDVLATFDKIVDQRDFNIKVEDFDYFIKDGDVQIKIEVGIHGVVEGEDRYVRDENFKKEDPLEEIENLIRDEKTTETVMPVKEPVREEINENEVVMENTVKQVAPVKNIEKTEPVYQEAKIVDATMIPETKEALVTKEAAIAEEISEQLQEKVYPSKSRPIFQDTADSVGTYYLYIVKENDSYSEVASRYNVDENAIRDYNQDKALQPGSVLIIPYVCQ